MTEPVWESFTGRADRLVVVRCTQCHAAAGTYWANPERLEAGAWEPGRCQCAPAPTLPSGDELDRLVRRAVRSGKPAVTRRGRSLP